MVARVGEEATPAIKAPVSLRPFLQFAKLPARAVGAARRAVDSDEEFRSRVAEVVSEDDVGLAGWLWLTRPEGWEPDLDVLQQELAEAGDAAADRRAENEARRRLAGAEAATQRAETAAAAARADAAQAAAALAEERRARRASAQEAEQLTARLEKTAAERDRARADRDRARSEVVAAIARATELEAELDELRRTPPPVPVEVAPPVPVPQADGAPDAADTVAAAAGALLGASSAAAALAASLAAAAVALDRGVALPVASPPLDPVVPTAPAVAAPPARPMRRRRRRAVPLPPGMLDDTVEAADHLVRVPGITLLVDGYNVSQTGWPELAIAEQRRRLVDALTELAARTAADIAVVFDGADPMWPPAVPATARRVHVSFSPAEVEADDVVLARVADLDPSKPVLVASSDRRVQDGAAALGANVISSPQLLAALRR